MPIVPFAPAFVPPPLPPGPRPAFTILRGSTPAAAREYAALPLVRPWRELARAVDPTGRLPLDADAVWAGDAEGTLALPTRFDGRHRWGRLLSPPRDQGLSGACWAFAAVSALGDRAALWTHGAVRPWPDGIPRPGVFGGLSARDLVDHDFDALTEAQTEAEADVVAANEVHHGGRHADYGHTLAGALEALYVRGVACQGGWRCRPLAHYALASAAEADLKAEIFAWGPVASAFALHEDFMYPERHPGSWVGGVYRHDPVACPRAFGGHAVVLVGWCEAWLPSATQHASAHGIGPDARDRPRKHTCWIARHAWGPTWAGGAHADGHFALVAGQCHLEANVVACVPDVAGLALNPRDAHRVAPPSSAARRRRAAAAHAPESDLTGPTRIDTALLCDMSAFVAAEVYGPRDHTGQHRGASSRDGAADYADGRWPASDAWTTALSRAWVAPAGLVPSTGHTTLAARRSPVALPAGSHAHMEHDFDIDHHRHHNNADGNDYDHAPYAPDYANSHLDDVPYRGPYDAPPSQPLHHHAYYDDPIGGDGDDDAYSNSDAELSDDERHADARHRLSHRRYRRSDSPL